MEKPTKTQISRAGQLEALGNDTFDVLVLGGGISGVSAAHVLTARGYRVALIDNHDFASGTSQESSQLIWGGIKYLENGHVKLVNELCKARNALVRNYKDRVAPLPFLYPHFQHDPHSLMTLMMGAYLYRVIGRGFAERPRYLSTKKIQELVPHIRTAGFHNGFQYYDARMIDSDARLTLDFLFDAMHAGLTAANYLNVTAIHRKADEIFDLDVEDQVHKRRMTIKAKWIVNTTGVWADETNQSLDVSPPYRHLFSKGAHIVVPKIETHDRALTCLSKDGRVFFVIPWGEVTLIGTTDTPFHEPPQRVKADQSDIEYLRTECEAKFNLKLGEKDIINTKAGLRPLLAPAKADKNSNQDFLALARSHKVWSDPKARVTCLWGGKYTNCFLIAEEIAETVTIVPRKPALKQIDVLESSLEPNERVWKSGEWDRGRLAEACSREMVVKLEDFLRRRTNIELKLGLQIRASGLEDESPLRRTLNAITDAVSDTAKAS